MFMRAQLEHWGEQHIPNPRNDAVCWYCLENYPCPMLQITTDYLKLLPVLEKLHGILDEQIAPGAPISPNAMALIEAIKLYREQESP